MNDITFYLLAYWALPGLITMFLLLQANRLFGKRLPEDLSSMDWLVCLAASIAYPIGIVMLFGIVMLCAELLETLVENDWLTKERQWKKDSERS